MSASDYELKLAGLGGVISRAFWTAGRWKWRHTLIDAEIQETGGASLVPETPTSHLRLVDHPRRVKLEDTEVI